MKNSDISKIISANGYLKDGDWVLTSDMDPQGEVRLIQLKDIGVGSFLNKSNKRITTSKLKELKGTLIQKNDILISRMSEPICRACIFPGSPDPCIVAVDISILRVDINKTSTSYLVHIFNSAYFKRNAESYARGTTRTRITRKNLEKLKFPLPPLDIQKKTATVLDKAAASLRKCKKAIAKLDDLIQSVFLDMFGDPVTNPKDWERNKFSTILKDDLRNGLSPSNKGNIQHEVLTLSAITGNQFDSTQQKTAYFEKKPAANQTVHTNLLLICRGNGNKDLVGSAKFPDINDSCLIYPDTIISAPINFEICSPSYIQSIWESPYIRNQIENKARTTNGTFKINQSALRSLDIIVPDLNVQKKYQKIYVKYQVIRSHLETELKSIDTLYNSLLQRAFKGELKFNDKAFK